MKCEYDDGMKVRYTGPFQVTKGEEVNVFIKEDLIPDNIKSDLDSALFRNSCSEMRDVAEAVTKKFGAKACIHERDDLS